MPPWEKYQQAQPAEGPWQKYAAPEQEKPVFSGGVLPFSRYEDGRVEFDSNAGILGLGKNMVRSAVDALKLPGDVYQGKVDPRSDQAIERAANLGVMATPMTPGVRSGEGWAAALQKPKKATVPAPTMQALEDAGEAGYRQARSMGVDYRPEAIKDMALKLKVGLDIDGVVARNAPKSYEILDELTSLPQGAIVQLSDLDAARQSFRDAAMDFAHPKEQLVATRAIQAIDEFVSRADPASVMAGPAAAAGQVQSAARGNVAAAKRSGTLAGELGEAPRGRTGIQATAELRAAAANSGRNLDNTIRQRIASLLLDPKQAAGFTAAEKEALEEVARGTPTRNAIRTIGNLLGGGGGLGAVVSGGVGGATGAALGGPVGMAVGAGVPALGWGTKSIGNKMTKGALQAVDEATRMRSPLYQELLKSAPNLAQVPPEKRAALIRALLMARQPPSPPPPQYTYGPGGNAA